MALGQTWTRIGQAKSNDILVSIQKTNKKLYATAVEVLAPRLKMRPVKILELPKAERHAAWMGFLAHPQYDPLTHNLFCEWLAKNQSALMVRWLDALGAPHNGSGAVDAYPPCPSSATLSAALEAVLADHPADDVLVYLSTFNAAVETRWPELDAFLATDPRLPLPALPEPR